ncbi:MAG: hypothetical protein NZ585_01070 [Chloracidobacterium sp.]|nr:hypothetical protein [Chloracidobacterium sp.]MDW8216403.1 hypothetical protein [Acidobacteriota bacterium]
MFPLVQLALGRLLPALAVNWWFVGGVALVAIFILLAVALLWFALRQLRSTPDTRDVGDDGLLGLVASDPFAPAQPAALEPVRAETPAPGVAPVTPLERGLAVEIRPRVTAEDIPTLTTENLPALTAVSEPLSAALPRAETPAPVVSPLLEDAPVRAATNKLTPPEEAPPPSTTTGVLSPPATAKLPSPAASTSPLAQDIQEQPPHTSPLLGREATAPLATASPAEGARSPVTLQERAPVEAQTANLREARLTERLPAQRKALRPPQPPPAAAPLVAAPASVAATPVAPPESPPVQVIPKVASPAPLRPATEVPPPRFLGDDRPTGIGREAAWLGVLLALFVTVLGSLVVVFFPAARNRLLPPSWAERVAALPRGLGIEAPPPPPIPAKQVEVRQYANTYSSAPKGATGKIARTVTIAGRVKNISNEKLSDLRVEIELYPREPDGAPPERRIIYLTPATLEPGQEGRYTLTVADADYRQSSLKRIITGDGKDLKEVPAVFIPGTLEPPAEVPAKTAPAQSPTPSRRRPNA